MSRIGKKPILLPKNVTFQVTNNTVTVKGPLGEDTCEFCNGLYIVSEGQNLELKIDESYVAEKLDAKHGLYRSLIANIISGVSQGFEKNLEINGVGYRAQQQSKDIQFSLGFSHPVLFKAPKGIELIVVDQTHIKIKGFNKQLVGQVAANIRKLKGPEPYKGKGIKYEGENIRRKAGKTGK